MSLWLILGSTALVILIVLGGTFLLLTLTLRRASQRWHDTGVTFIREPESANYRGHASINVPVKGNGLLALTHTDLRFRHILPRTEFIIPFTHITVVELCKSWKHSYRPGFPVLVVHYHAGDDQDAIGFMVQDVQNWAAAIAEAAQVAPPELDE